MAEIIIDVYIWPTNQFCSVELLLTQTEAVFVLISAKWSCQKILFEDVNNHLGHELSLDLSVYIFHRIGILIWESWPIMCHRRASSLLWLRWRRCSFRMRAVRQTSRCARTADDGSKYSPLLCCSTICSQDHFSGQNKYECRWRDLGVMVPWRSLRWLLMLSVSQPLLDMCQAVFVSLQG